MVTNIPDLERHRDRAKALDRAVKMGALFKYGHFKPIMDAVYLNAPGQETLAESNFRTACADAGLDSKEATWLWNYLSHYKDMNWEAGTGW